MLPVLILIVHLIIISLMIYTESIAFVEFIATGLPFVRIQRPFPIGSSSCRYVYRMRGGRHELLLIYRIERTRLEIILENLTIILGKLGLINILSWHRRRRIKGILLLLWLCLNLILRESHVLSGVLKLILELRRI